MRAWFSDLLDADSRFPYSEECWVQLVADRQSVESILQTFLKMYVEDSCIILEADDFDTSHGIRVWSDV